MLYQIYLITNIKNGKKYVGQTHIAKNWNYLNRFNNHLNGAIFCQKSGKHLNVFQAAICSYGPENFKVELIEDEIPEELIDYREIYYIQYFDTYYKNNKGYNMTYGGQGCHGYHHSPEVLKRISESSKKYWENLKVNNIEEYNRLCQNRSIKFKGIPKSEETKIKLKEAVQRRIHSKDYVNPFKGKKHSQKTKDIIALKNGVKVGMYDSKTDELLKTFNSADEATRYLISIGLTSNIYAKSRILYCCDSETRLAYGYRWRKL